LYLDARPASDGSKMKAALDALHPVALRRGPLVLPRFRYAMKELQKRAPARHRLAVPEELCFATCGRLLSQGKVGMALKNATDFSCYLRPGESMSLRTLDLVIPADFAQAKVNQRHVLLLAPFEREQPTKTGAYDEAVILDDSRCPHLGVLLEEFMVKRLEKRKMDMDSDDGTVNLWDFSGQEFKAAWGEVTELFHISDLYASPYQNRHGGVSRDRLMKLRSLAECRDRGRWAQDSTLKCYEKSARLQEVLNSLGPELLRYGEKIRQHFASYVRSGTAPKPPPAGRTRRRRA